MTNQSALVASVGYPLNPNQVEFCLFNQNLVGTEDYVACKAFDLAVVDALMIVLITPNITEGGYSISNADKASIKERINSISSTHGMVNPTAAQVRDKSNIW